MGSAALEAQRSTEYLTCNQLREGGQTLERLNVAGVRREGLQGKLVKLDGLFKKGVQPEDPFCSLSTESKSPTRLQISSSSGLISVFNLCSITIMKTLTKQSPQRPVKHCHTVADKQADQETNSVWSVIPGVCPTPFQNTSKKY
jgi:hypothetical protein